MIGFHSKDYGQDAAYDISPTVRAAENENGGTPPAIVTAFDWQASAGNDESWRGKGRQHVVRSGDYAGAVSATRTDAVFGDGVARSLTARNERIDAETENLLVAGPVRASDGHHGHSSPRGDGADNLIAWDDRNQAADTDAHHTLRGAGLQRSDVVSGGMGVRRLTPLECERLQGWPDEHTRWMAEGLPIPDSHRYQMIGNGVASPCAEWIGHRMVEANRW
jgi:site-specific DNA-cytosine methylase